MDPRHTFGQSAEQRAKQHLLDKGYQFVAQNFRCHFGEIDLIFKDKDQLVFVEVKARADTVFGVPEEAVNRKKLAKMHMTAEIFFQKNPQYPYFGRFDAISIDASTNKLAHHTNITI